MSNTEETPDLGVLVQGEADRKELTLIMTRMSRRRDEMDYVDRRTINMVFDLLPRGMGYWLRNSEPLEDGSYRGEIRGGLIVYAVPRAAKDGVAFGNPYHSPEHFDIYLKFEDKAADEFAQEMGKPVEAG